MHRTAIITATANTPDLHEDDEHVAGVYGVVMGDEPGTYPMEPRDDVENGDDPLQEAAKDVFHDHVGIRVLDDFDIGIEILPEDADASARDEVHWL